MNTEPPQNGTSYSGSDLDPSSPGGTPSTPLDVDCRYVCINCGKPVESLCKQYSSSVLKIIKCSNCSLVADKYIEFEPIVILIDIVLLGRQAYRHVLFNTDFYIRWKLALLLVLFESYILSKEKQQHSSSSLQTWSAEQLFYVCILLCCADWLLLSAMLAAMARLYTHCIGEQRPAAESLRQGFFGNVLKCVTLANVTKLFLLPSVVWHSNMNAAGIVLHRVLVGLYYAVALVQIVSVLCGCSRRMAVGMVGAALLANALLNAELSALEERWF